MTVLALIPTLVIFIALQRYFMQGLLSGSIKAYPLPYIAFLSISFGFSTIYIASDS